MGRKFREEGGEKRQRWDKDQRGHKVSRKEYKPGALVGYPGVWREQWRSRQWDSRRQTELADAVGLLWGISGLVR